MSQQLYVSTDARGTQYFGDAEVKWALPVPSPDGTFAPGGLLTAEGQPLALLSLDGLLDGFGERIFLAELGEGSGAELTGFGVAADSARLVSGTAWSVSAAATFALDCAAHALGTRSATTLPSGASLGEVLEAARRWLERSESDDGGLLGRVSRLATARRLRKAGGEVGEAVFALTMADAGDDVDVLDDPEWAAMAAIRDAVLAAVEAIRHNAFPQLVEDENIRYELDSEANDDTPELVETPWGSFMAGRRSGVVPAWIAARDAAERSRQAVRDQGAPEAVEAERAWQRERLLAALD